MYNIDNTHRIQLNGTIPSNHISRAIFDRTILEFIETYRMQLKTDPQLSNIPECISLTYWLRPQNLNAIKQNISYFSKRKGKGLIFIVPPSNIPLLALYNFFIALLSGNSAIIRISEKAISDLTPYLKILYALWNQKKFLFLSKENAFITYNKTTDYSAKLSQTCDGRIIWGSDSTINKIRTYEIPATSFDIAFGNKYSIAVIDANNLSQLSKDSFNLFAYRLYADIYTFDQNACASPRIIIWTNYSSLTNLSEIKQKLWQNISTEAYNYDLTPYKVSNKYTSSWQLLAAYKEISSFSHWGNYLYVYTLNNYISNISDINLNCGQVFQLDMPNISDITLYLDNRVQTITTNYPPEILRHIILKSSLPTIKRIVPFGMATSMDIVWDGVHLIECQSDIIL